MFASLPDIFVNALILFIVTEGLLCASPGPAVLLTISQSMKNGFGAGIISTLGILTANTLYFVLSAIGVGALIIASNEIFTIVKYAGAAYLIYMGVMMLIPLIKSLINRNKITDDEEIKVEKRQSNSAVFIKAFVIQASNPKNLVFFVALLPQFVIPSIEAEISIVWQFTILAILSIIIELVVLLVYIVLSINLAKWIKDKAMVWIDGAAGLFLISIGVGLAFWKKIEQ